MPLVCQQVLVAVPPSCSFLLLAQGYVRMRSFAYLHACACYKVAAYIYTMLTCGLYQVTDTATFVPSETLVWDYIMHQVNHPAIATVAKMHKSQPASTTNAFIGKQPVVLSNMSATCTEKEEDADTGQLQKQPVPTLPGLATVGS